MTTPQAQRRRQRETMVILIVVGFLVLLATFRQAQINNSLHDNVDAIHNSQIQACETALHPGGIRFVIAEQIRQQLRQGKAFDYSKFFPNVPPDELQQLLERSRMQQRQEIHDLLDVDCSAIYPKP